MHLDPSTQKHITLGYLVLFRIYKMEGSFDAEKETLNKMEEAVQNCVWKKARGPDTIAFVSLEMLFNT